MKQSKSWRKRWYDIVLPSSLAQWRLCNENGYGTRSSKGIKDITIASSSLSPCHEFLVEMIQDGTVTAIEHLACAIVLVNS